MDKDQVLTQIEDAVHAHSLWKIRLRKAARDGETNLPVEMICLDDQCKFGKWLGQLSDEMNDSPRVAEVRQLHLRFHLRAGDVARMIQNGAFASAQQALDDGPFMEATAELTRALSQWKRMV